MRLVDLKHLDDINISRDGHFESLGMIDRSLENVLVFLEGRRFLPLINTSTNITCVITTEDLVREIDREIGVCVSPTPKKTFFEVHQWLSENTSFYWEGFESEIADDVSIHPSAVVAPRDVRIGRGSIIGPNVNVLERTVIGDGVVIQAGATLGSNGFEFKRFGTTIMPVPHAGGVQVGNQVEIQANCTISRSIFAGWTSLGDETKLDNLVHIAHDVTVGRRCLIAASAMVAGSATIGDDVWIGPGACISNGVKVADNAKISLGSVVIADVGEGERVSGNFAVSHRKFAKFIAAMRRS